MRFDPHLAAGLNIHAGHVTYPAVATELGYKLLPVDEAMKQDPNLANGLNVSNGKIRHKAVADALDLAYEPVGA